MSSHAEVVPLTSESVTPGLVVAVTALLDDLVVSGAALGWVTPPDADEVSELLHSVAVAAGRGDAYCAIVYGTPSRSDRVAQASAPASAGQIGGFGYWLRYRRATHQPHADLPHLAIAQSLQGRGLGGLMLDHLVGDARTAGLEQLTLDCRADNVRAQALWRSRGFVEYGRLPDFVAVGDQRYDKTLWVLDLRADLTGQTG
ncbi:MAG: GNAT family N-acetyltransferase [Actinomycetes bacterium]